MTDLRKSGCPPSEEYLVSSIIERLKPIRLAIAHDLGINDNLITEQDLGKLCFQINSWMDRYMGRDSPRPRPATRIDAHVINDLDLNGGLRHTLGFVLKYAQQQKWTEIPFDNPSMHSRIADMFHQLWKYLREKNFIPERRIYFDESLDIGSRNRLAQIAKSHGAEIVDHPSKASHIILPDNDDMKGEDDSNDLRTLQVDTERNKALIHWWFYPASYDEWIESSLVEGDPMNFNHHPSEAWRLGERFINDLERYNEWMVEFDYEIFEEYLEPEEMSSLPVETSNENYNNHPNIDANNSSTLNRPITESGITIKTEEEEEEKTQPSLLTNIDPKLVSNGKNNTVATTQVQAPESSHEAVGLIPKTRPREGESFSTTTVATTITTDTGKTMNGERYKKKNRQ